MPLHKQYEHEDEEQQYIPQLPVSPWTLAGFAEASWTAVSDRWTTLAGLWAKPADPKQPDVPRVGRYYADYSELTPEEIAQADDECEALFRRSKPISR